MLCTCARALLFLWAPRAYVHVPVSACARVRSGLVRMRAHGRVCRASVVAVMPALGIWIWAGRW